jgi:hypothetical protein
LLTERCCCAERFLDVCCWVEVSKRTGHAELFSMARLVPRSRDDAEAVAERLQTHVEHFVNAMCQILFVTYSSVPLPLERKPR